jgi:hypothetical protein
VRICEGTRAIFAEVCVVFISLSRQSHNCSSIMPQVLKFTRFLFDHSSVFTPFDATQSETLTVSLNKPTRDE